MKKTMKVWMAAACLVALTPDLWAQTPVEVKCNELKQKGGELVIDAEVTVDASDMKAREHLSLTPVIESASQKEGLPSILVNGRISQKVYDREQALGNLTEEEPRYTVVRAEKMGNVVHYKTTVPFEPWMKEARLVLVPNLCGCGKEAAGEPIPVGKVLVRPDKPYVVQPVLAYITPEAETVKRRAEVGTAYLDFQVGRYAILPNFRNNAEELEKIGKTIQAVAGDPNITPKGIVLKGYASPEGSYRSNALLAENRVKALRDYIGRKHDFRSDFFRLETEPEDWEGFEAKAEADIHVPDREAVLAIIKSGKEPDRKEAELRNLNGGAAYRYVLAGMFPSLRRSEYRIDYTVREFTVEEGREVIQTHPEQLSLNEMFAVANSYEVGSEEYNRVFETAVRLYADDPVANLNAANIALSKNDREAARGYLAKAGNSPEAIHARGVLALMEGNLEEAAPLLKQAQEAGVKGAAANLDELRKKEEDNRLFDSFK